MTRAVEDDLRAGPPAAGEPDRRALGEHLGGRAEIAFARVDSPVGVLVAAATARGLVRLAYEEPNGGLDAVLDRLAERLSPRIVEAPGRLDRVRSELDEFFAGERRAFDLDVDLALVGGPFAARLLAACAAIPFGAVSTYAELATAAGSPRAVRAAGNALSANPVPIVVPCHRVVRTGGGLGGYTGGLEHKELLLELERATSRGEPG